MTKRRSFSECARATLRSSFGLHWSCDPPLRTTHRTVRRRKFSLEVTSEFFRQWPLSRFGLLCSKVITGDARECCLSKGEKNQGRFCPRPASWTSAQRKVGLDLAPYLGFQ